MPILVDTGVLYALADRDDAWHKRARSFIENTPELLLVPVTVIPEVTYLLRARLGERAELAFVASLAAGELGVEPLTGLDLKQCAAIMARHTDIGFVDASVVAMAERLKVTTIATTDRSHFGQIRPKHCAAFALMP
jgi:hypothetical protein